MFDSTSRRPRAADDRPFPPVRRRLLLVRGTARRAMTALLLISVFGAGVGTDRVLWDGGDDADAASSLTSVKEFQVLQDAWNALHDNYVEVNTVSDKELLYGASRGMLEAVGDTGHTDRQ